MGRNYYIYIGSKAFFDSKVTTKISESYFNKEADQFLDKVKLSDEKRQRGLPFTDEDKSEILVLKNDNYNGIIETAHDRLGSLIEELTSENSTIFLHNPPTKLLSDLKSQAQINIVALNIEQETYTIKREPHAFSKNIETIRSRIFGQDNAISEVSKSMWYLTSVDRKKPYVIMLYGNSSLGKTELVREISASFYEGKFVEKHLSMFRNDTYSFYFFGDKPNRRCLGFDLLERESNLVFLDEIDKCPDHFLSAFYTLFDNTIFIDSTYEVDISGLLIILTSNYKNLGEIKNSLGLPIFYRIDKFIKFDDFDEKTIYEVTVNEINAHLHDLPKSITFDDVYHLASNVIMSSDENARTIKNKIQEVVEEILFQEVQC